MTIKFTQAAEADLLNIFVYGIEEFGLDQAEHYKAQLDNRFQTVVDNPKIARQRWEINPPVRIYPALQHIIVYRIEENDKTVLILRVRHHRENWLAHPLK